MKTNLQLIDAHNHLDAAQFDADRAAVYQRAQQAGVVAQVLAAVSAVTWPQLKTVTAQYAGLYASYGLHPMYLAEHRPEHLDALDAWLGAEPAVAVGECGLDYYLPHLDADLQAEYFLAQLQLAQRHQLPLVIHARRAVDQVLKLLRRSGGGRGMVHSFSGSEQQARQLLDLGFLLSFGGPLTYPRATRLQSLVRYLPLDALLLESDAPDQAPSAQRGQRNEPAFITQVLDCIAAIRGVAPEEIAAATSANTCRLFGLAHEHSTRPH